MHNIIIQNTQFKLYYLLIVADGEITKEEKESFLKIISKENGYTKSYAETLFNTIKTFKINYNYLIKTLNECDDKIKQETIDMLKKLSLVDGSYQKEEMLLIDKIKVDLKMGE
jgi:uncharacterized tellurite resistance protein B-like protein